MKPIKFKSRKELIETLLSGKTLVLSEPSQADLRVSFDADVFSDGDALTVNVNNFPYASLYWFVENKWYEDIPEEGVICWVWDNNEVRNHVTLVMGYDDSVEYPFRKGPLSGWKNAIPVKPSECFNGTDS